jgi:hypothetical protein
VRGIHGKGEFVVLARSCGADGPELCVSSDGGHAWDAAATSGTRAITAPTATTIEAGSRAAVQREWPKARIAV